MSCSVATYTTLWTVPLMVTPGTYSGWAKISPSTDWEKSFPKLVKLTFAGVRTVSLLSTLVRWLLYPDVVTLTWAPVGTAAVSRITANTPHHHLEKSGTECDPLFRPSSAESVISLETEYQ